MSWPDALAYCDWLTNKLKAWEGTPEPLGTLLQSGGRVTLPSEAEWEKAARGKKGRIYSWGNEWETDRANTGEAGIGRTSAVGCFSQGATPDGIYDLSGNVWEWTRSIDEAYPYPDNQKARAKRELLTTQEREARVRRGGAFFYAQYDARSAFRSGVRPDLRDSHLGFRVVVLPNL